MRKKSRNSPHTPPAPIRSIHDFIAWLSAKSHAVDIGEIYDSLCKGDPTQKAIVRQLVKAAKRSGEVLLTDEGYSVPKSLGTAKGWVEWDKDRQYLLWRDDGAGVLPLVGAPVRLYPKDHVEVEVVQSVHQSGYQVARFTRLLDAVKPKVVGIYRTNRRRPTIDAVHRSYQAFTISITESTFEEIPQDGDMVVVELTREGDRDTLFSTLIGRIDDPDTVSSAVEAACLQYDIPTEWSSGVEKAVSKLKPSVSRWAKRGRLDLREMPFVTIDGEDARDYDDAVFCERKPRGGYTLWVAIADVSNYVKPGSALDDSASDRGTSVYFPDAVVPMLPEILSNGLCSLVPHEDRLVLVAEMQISANGKLTRATFHEAMIHSHQRFTYHQVQQLIDGQPDVREEFNELWPHIDALHELYRHLKHQRGVRGAIDFETVETKLHFSKAGEIVSISPVERLTAHKIIEECMLMANVSAAKFLRKANMPALYRVHPGPPRERLDSLNQFLSERGLWLENAEEPTPKDYAGLIEAIHDRDDFRVLQTVLLRSLSQAVYTPDNEGHFGLAFDAYLHFTSPIRRYPDLWVHRAIRSVLQDDKKTMKLLREDAPGLERLAMRCSMTERRADEATRDVQKVLKCQYLEKHLGTEAMGTVSGVTSFGLFVELDDLYTDGLIHITGLGDDYYVYDADKHRLVGERTRQCFELGHRVRVTISMVDTASRKVDFTLLEHLSAKTAKGPRPKSAQPTSRSKGGRGNGPSAHKRGGKKPSGSGPKNRNTKNKKGKPKR